MVPCNMMQTPDLASLPVTGVLWCVCVVHAEL